MSYTRIPNYPLKKFQEVTKSDATTYDPPLICVRIGDTSGGSTLEATGIDGTAATFSNCSQGETIWGPFYKIMSTGTDVSGLVGWFNE